MARATRSSSSTDPRQPGDPAPAEAAPVEAARTRTGSNRRLKGPERRAAIISLAAEIFAEEGFSATTRDLAARLGVTQPLLYRFFPSKQALIDAVYEAVFRDRWDPAWDALLADARRPLRERLVAFYADYAARADRQAMRLFVRAGLEGIPLPGRRGAALTDQIFAPTIAAMRAAEGMPGFAERPMLRGERELAMTLHASVVFLGIRRHVYGMPMPEDVSDVVALAVDTFLAGAPETLRRLHAEGDGGMTVPQLRPRRRGG